MAICDLLTVQGAQTRGEIEALGRRSLFGKVDVSHPTEIEAFVEKVISLFRKVDILVNNAAMPSQGRSLEEVDADVWQRMMDTNLSSMFYFARPVAEHMIARGQGGIIINIASINSFVISNISPRHNVPYCVAKAGVAQLTRGMASDWAPYNVRVNAVAPGYVLTEQTARSRKYPEIVERSMANTPMKRYGRPDEIKGTVVYLASEASSFMTGSVVVIDGGMTIW